MPSPAQIGDWPRSRSVYGLDVMLAKLPGNCQHAASLAAGCMPQLLEVNSCPDFGPMSQLYESFVNDVFGVLFAGEDDVNAAPDTFLQL